MKIEGNGVTVKTRELGRTGIQVSPYCLGTMMFGRVANTDQDPCVRIILRALDSGINLVDTADVYSRSESEQILGKALRGRRDECWPQRSTARWVRTTAAPGTDIGPLDVSYTPPAITRTALRRRSAGERAAA